MSKLLLCAQRLLPSLAAISFAGFSQVSKAAPATQVVGNQTVRCSALLGGLLAFEFNPTSNGKSIQSVLIEAPDLSHTIKVQKVWNIPKAQNGVYFPLSAAEKKQVKLMEPLIAIRANNHNNQVETFVWGAINNADQSRFGILLHQKDGKITPIRFGNCILK